MRKSKIRAKLDAGGVAKICTLGAFIPYYPHMAAQFGYDGVWVCAEHRAWDPRQIEAMLAQHRLADIDCVWRPPTTEHAALSRLLEDGATALMMPMVNTPERARQLVNSAKFPPVGDRGMDGSGMDGNFGRKPVDYTAAANRETLLMVMIESPQSLYNAADMAAIEGVDALFMGPGDLSLRLGCTPSIRDAKIRGAVERMAKACEEHGKPWGFPVGNIEDAETVVEMGARVLCFGNEFVALQDHLRRHGEQLDELLA